MVEKRAVMQKNGIVRHIPVKYNKHIDKGHVTIAVSITKDMSEFIEQRKNHLRYTRSRVVQDMLALSKKSIDKLHETEYTKDSETNK